MTANFWYIGLVAMALSIGWGIRGNYGHEHGAMIPGALATLAAALLSGRADWRRRLPFFAFFGAVGWAFGGSMSYMQVIAYTHSGHSGSVLYGFASLFLIGFLWAALGGAGSAAPVFLSRVELTELLVPLNVVFGAWLLQDLVVGVWFAVNPDFRHESVLYWYDTNWLSVLVAILAIAALAVARRRWDWASSLILHAALGWWAGFLSLVVLLGWRMTPPRGDNWAGCVGMVAGLWVYFARRGWVGLTFSSLVTGLIGGFGFATADLLKLVELTSGWDANWHSVLEQTYGAINGAGLAIAFLYLARWAPEAEDSAPPNAWVGPYAVGFVLLAVTYLNLERNPGDWISAKAMPATMYGLATQAWFGLGYLAIAAAGVGLMASHRRRPLAIMPATAFGRGQLFFLVLLWWMVLGNFERSIPGFTQRRLVTEGLIHLNAVLCSCGVLLGAGAVERRPTGLAMSWTRCTRETVVAGVLWITLSVLADWGIVRGIYGDRFAGSANLHIRFGPHATATKEKPPAGQPHP